MMTDVNDLKAGVRVRVAKLDDTGGMMIVQRHIDARRAGAVGTALGYVPGHGGDVWWVEHDGGGVVAAYCYTELEIVE